MAYDLIMALRICTWKEAEIRYTQGTMRKQYTATFKVRVVQELLKEEKTIAQIAAAYEVHPTRLKNWRAVASCRKDVRRFKKN